MRCCICFFSKGEFVKGIDKLEDIIQDDFNYSDSLKKEEYCLKCQSARLVYFDTYKKHVEAKQQVKNITQHQNLAHFVGCLNCHAQYSYKPKHKFYSYKEFYYLFTIISISLFAQYYFDYCEHLYYMLKLPTLIAYIIMFVFIFLTHSLLFSFYYFTESWNPKLKAFGNST